MERENAVGCGYPFADGKLNGRTGPLPMCVFSLTYHTHPAPIQRLEDALLRNRLTEEQV